MPNRLVKMRPNSGPDGLITDPRGAMPPLDWWTIVNRCRALENLAYVVAANQGAEANSYPPFSWHHTGSTHGGR
jgi:predicted amidohydrolase